jgi:hypothetical protein
MDINEKLELLTTDRDVRDMVVQTLEAGHGAEDFDVDGIVAHLWDNRHTGRVEDFYDVVAEYDTTA